MLKLLNAKCWFLTHRPLGDQTEYLDEQLKSVIVGWNISCETDLRWISLDLTVSMEYNGLVPSGNPFWISIVFYPRPVLAFGYCRCLRLSVCVSVRPCVNHELVRAITHDPYQLGSPNLDRKCKRPWLRSLLFLGVIDPDLQGQI